MALFQYGQTFPAAQEADRGVTMRDYVAICAMQGMLAANKEFPIVGAHDKVADEAFKFADALLRRSQKENKDVQ